MKKQKLNKFNISTQDMVITLDNYIDKFENIILDEIIDLCYELRFMHKDVYRELSERIDILSNDFSHHINIIKCFLQKKAEYEKTNSKKNS